MNTHPPGTILLQKDDHSGALRLFRQAGRTHLHLDWRDLSEWLPHPDFRCRVVKRRDAIASLLGATIHRPLLAPPGESPDAVAWLRFAVPARPLGDDPALDLLWRDLQEDLRREGVRQAALLSIDPWIGQVARRWGFTRETSVITLHRIEGAIPPPPDPPLCIRPVGPDDDLEPVARVDAASFSPIWQYSAETLEVARRQAAIFSRLENDGRLLGYQLSTQYNASAHLARLAILPDEQGKGYGGLLVGDMLRFFASRRISLVTVNTQENNHRSQMLYSRLGFVRAGSGVPVWTFDFEATLNPLI
jgi:ribosomal-protein-alanine N-acetyltransferase